MQNEVFNFLFLFCFYSDSDTYLLSFKSKGSFQNYAVLNWKQSEGILESEQNGLFLKLETHRLNSSLRPDREQLDAYSLTQAK